MGHAPAHRGGQSVPLRSLLRHYDAIVFAYGASKDKTLGIPGESLKRIYSAREFVGWYNGLPEFANLNPDLSQERAIVLGQGNVALDVTRVLLQDVDKLRNTDIADYALEALSRSRVREVRMFGRRGPMQAAFTIKELRELTKLQDTGFIPMDKQLIPPWLADVERPRRRLMELLAEGSKANWESAAKKWSFEFCLSPYAFHPDAHDVSSVGRATFLRTDLSDIYDPKASVKAENGSVEFEAPLVFRSIGYKSEPLSEFATLGIPFDESRGVIRTNDDHGRVAPAKDDEGTEHFPGLYCAGWVRYGPTGVISKTMKEAFITASAIVQDWKAGKKFLDALSAVEGRDEERRGWEGVKSEGESELAKNTVDWEGWLAIDKAEKEKGQKAKKTREKITAIEEMISLATSKKSR